MKRSFFFRLLCAVAAVLLLSTGVLAADYNGARDAISDGFAANAEKIPLEEYDLKIDDLRDLFYGMINDNLLPWYAQSFSYTYHEDSGIIIEMTPNNMDETIYDHQTYERAVQKVLDEAVFPGMSDLQIALSVHDYLASRFCYDETYTYYEGYDLLVGGTAVCEGYARAYMDILKRAGVDAIYATSEAMDHGWNLVKINGNWYHVDVTWDDPISDYYGRVRHFYFLVDDDMISDEEHEHYGWETSQSADSDDLNSNVFWQESDNPICYESASVSYIRIDKSNEHWIYRRNEKNGEYTELVYYDAGYVDIGHGSYHYANYGLSLWDGRLYYSDMENVYSMNTDGSDQTVVYTHDAEANGTFIRGSFVNEGVIYLTLSDHDNNISQTEAAVPGHVPHEHSYTEERIEPTCTEAGYVNYICSCGDSYRGDALEATGHVYDDGTITLLPTTEAEGVRTFACLFCDHSYTESITALEEETPPTSFVPEVSPPSPTISELPTQTELPERNFPVVPVAIGVVVLILVILLPTLLGRKKQSRRTSGVRHQPSGDDYGGDSGDYGDYGGYSSSESDDYSGDGYDGDYGGDSSGGDYSSDDYNDDYSSDYGDY